MIKHLNFVTVLALISIVLISCQEQYVPPVGEIQNPNSSALIALSCEKRLELTNQTDQWLWRITNISQGIEPLASSPTERYEYTKCGLRGIYASQEPNVEAGLIIGLNRYFQPFTLDESSVNFTDFSGEPTSITMPNIEDHQMFQRCLRDEELLTCVITVGYDYEKLYLRLTADRRIPVKEIEDLIGKLLLQLNDDILSSLY